MVDVAKVKMFGKSIGTFSWDDRYGVARFEYDHSFIGSALEPSPLMMPVRAGRVYSFGNLGRNSNTQIEIDKLVEVAKEALDEKSTFAANLENDKKLNLKLL